MTKALRTALTDMGMSLDNIRFEIFTPTPYGKSVRRACGR
jgi:hypothetical protein